MLMTQGNTYAQVVADSISPDGVRLTTFEVRFHRFVLSEMNTHRVFSRNSASSRAIPVEKMLARFEDETAWPIAWTREQPGMQGGGELEGQPLEDAEELFGFTHFLVDRAIKKYLDKHPDKSDRLHKSRINRLMEWGQYHTAVITSTAWDNFFGLRCHEMAEPEIRLAAEAMKAAYDASTPQKLSEGEWHLPYITDDDIHEVQRQFGFEPGTPEHTEVLVKSSAACCARTSYLTQNKARDFEADFVLYDRLTTAWPMHASPLEHVATPDYMNKQTVMIGGVDFDGEAYSKMLTLPRYGNFMAWQQRRIQVEARMDYQSYS